MEHRTTDESSDGKTTPTIRLLTSGDLSFAAALTRIAGWNQVEADWAGYLALKPDGCFLAEIAGKPAGTATTVAYDGEVGWIGMLLVHPDSRRSGVGTALLNHCIRHLSGAGIRAIKLDATPMGKQVYIPIGFADEYEVNRYEGMLPAASVEWDATFPSGGVSVIEDADLAELNAFDREYFGVGRWHALNVLIGRRADWSLVARSSDGRIAGCLLAREGYEAVQLGPWTARDGEVARRLLAEACRRMPGRRVYVDVPCLNRDGMKLMDALGFKVQRGFTRMTLGENRHPGRPEGIYGTAGAEKG